MNHDKTVLILGARSDMAQALAQQYAKFGFNLQLAARSKESLEKLALDIKIRHQVEVRTYSFDALDYGSHEAFYQSLSPKPDGVICTVGYLGEQKGAEKDFSEAHKIIDSNFTGPVSILNIVANDFETRKTGFIIGVSSVAGDRGRQSNYLYGSAKAAFSAYLSGLRNRLYPSGVHVLTVKPGFVHTSMTKGLDLPEKLTAEPNEVAKDIFKAQIAKKDVIYTKWFWSPIMAIIKNIPETIFKKTNI